MKGHTQNGNARLDAALDRFSLDVAEESISVHERSDYINRAAAIVAPKCYLCFQALESIGVDQFNVYLMTEGQEHTLETYGREIIPRFTGGTA